MVEYPRPLLLCAAAPDPGGRVTAFPYDGPGATLPSVTARAGSADYGVTVGSGITETAGRIQATVERVIVGKREAVRLSLIVLLAEGHLLVEDVPGVGKTMLAKALARSIDCSVRRIQFTPDLLPSDITGVSVFDQQRREFEFKP